MAIGALQTGYTTLYGKVAGLGTQNGQTRGSSFREHIDGTEKKGRISIWHKTVQSRTKGLRLYVIRTEIGLHSGMSPTGASA